MFYGTLGIDGLNTPTVLMAQLHYSEVSIFWFVVITEPIPGFLKSSMTVIDEAKVTETSKFWPRKRRDTSAGFSFLSAFIALKSLFFNLQSTLVISNSKGLTEILRDIHTSTYRS